MPTKNEIKLIRSLSRKRNRQDHRLFIVEGHKTVSDFLSEGYEPKFLLTTEDSLFPQATSISEKQMKQVSLLSSPPGVLAVFSMPAPSEVLTTGKRVFLDDISDPGNLGTIIRLCDWFGIDQLLCSPETVDCYNPKVVQASMGSLARMNICYTQLTTGHHLDEVYAAMMEGKSIYELEWQENGILVMGSESHGVSERIQKNSTGVSIPRYDKTSEIDSLNVGTATAIILSEWVRSTGR